MLIDDCGCEYSERMHVGIQHLHTCSWANIRASSVNKEMSGLGINVSGKCDYWGILYATGVITGASPHIQYFGLLA